MNTAIEQNTLLWVKQELDETLKQARQMLESHVEQPEDPSHLRFCAGYLHQVAGTLQMVEIYGASLLAEEMEKLVLDLLEDRVTQKEDAVELLMQGIIQLPDYLDRLAAGHRDIPLVLLPLLNDLRAVRGEPLLSENALFTPDLERSIPVSVRGLSLEENEDPATLARRLRHRYQLGLLNWFRERAVEQGLSDIQEVLDRLRSACREERAQKLWWIAGGLARALRQGLLESSMASKLLLGQVDRMIKRLIDEGEDGLVAAVPDDLLRNLLFYVGRARTGDDDVDLIRETWNLDRMLPDEDEIEDARESLSGHNQSLIESVTAAVREDLAALCEQFDVQIRSEQPDNEGLDALREPIQRVADTLGMIGMGALRRQILDQVGRLDEAASSEGEAREQALQSIAEALVMVDTALGGLQSGALGQEALEKEDGDVASIVPASEFRQVRSVVTAEALKDIALAKEAFTEYLAGPDDVQRLDPVPARFEEVVGSLLLLEENRAARLLEKITHYVRDALMTRTQPPGDEILEALAEAISAIEYYIENLNEPKVYGAEILEVAEDALDRLGIRVDPELRSVASETAEAGESSRKPAPEAEEASVAVPEEGGIEWTIEGLEESSEEEVAPALGDRLAEETLDTADGETPDSLEVMEVELDALQPEDDLEDDFAGEEDAAVELAGDAVEEIDLTALGDEPEAVAVTIAAEEEPEPIPVEDAGRDGAESPAGPSAAAPAAEPASLPPFESPWPVLEGDEVDEEILEIFLEEADEEIANIRTLLPRWLEDPEDQEALTEMRRSWHTLKGSGRLVGAMLIGEFAWAFENMLNRVIDGTIERSPEMEALLRHALDALPQLVAQVRGEGDPELDVLAMIADAEALARSESIEPGEYRRTATAPAVTSEGPREEGGGESAAEPEVESIEIALQAPEAAEVDLLAEMEAVDEEAVAEAGEEAPAGSGAAGGFDPELLAIFRREAEGHLKVLEEYVDLARSGGRGVDETLVRATHTLHGSACMAGADSVARIAGALEQHVKQHVADGARLSDEALDVMEEAIGHVRSLIELLDRPGEPLPDIDAVVARIEALPGGESGPPAGVEDLSVKLVEPDSTIPGEEASPEGRHALVDVGEEGGLPEVEVIDLTTAAAEESAEAETVREAEQAAVEEITLEVPQEASAEEAPEVVEVPIDEEAGGNEEVVRVEAAPVEEGEGPVEVLDEPAGPAEEVVSIPDEEVEIPAAAEPVAEVAAAEQETRGEAGQSTDAGAVQQEEAAGGAPVEEGEDVDPELLEIFLEEGEEILARMEEVLGRWMEAPEDRELINAMQRELHTLKGGARMAGLTRVADLSHHLESFQIAVEDGRIPVTPDVFELMQLAHDRLVIMLESAAAGQMPAAPDDLIARIEALRNGEPLPASGAPDETVSEPERLEDSEQAAVAAAMAARAEAASAPAQGQAGEAARRAPGEKQEMVRVRADLLDSMVNFAGEISIYRARLEQQVGAYRFNLNELTQTVMRLREQLRQMEIETETQIVARYERETGDYAHEDFDPLEMDQYSTLQTLSRAMGESINDLLSIHGQLDAITKESETLLVQQARVSTELQEGLMRTRMVPFSGLGPRMRRIVRQACQELGKRAELVLEGAEGEMDRTVIERIIAPLEHMLRNAIAHGIEPPEVRREKGKRETGTIRVALRREGSEVVIRLSDDGAGMNVEAIRAKAVERGLIKPDAELSDREIIQFVLETGFSTAGEVTQIAGRGVGMDVVNSEVKQLGGTLTIDSTPGAGTTFTIRLPFTLAITQALMVRVGEELFAIPLTSIEGVVRMSQDELQAYYRDPEKRFEYAGFEYQVRHLGTLLSQDFAPAFGKGTPRRLPVLLVRSGEQHMAIQVDALLGSREAVVKSVGPQISTVRGVSGATILGDGRVVLILDMSGLLRSLETRAALESEVREVEPQEEPSDRPPLVMVVDDSITVRKVTTRLLERNEMQVITAKDGVDAVGKLQDHVPDIMLLDIEMPRMDGFELATHIRNEPRLQHIPIIMITSRTGEKHRKRAMEIGVDRYLGKPYQEAELLETMRELMEARTAHA